MEELHFPVGEEQSSQDDVWAREWAAFVSRVRDSDEARNGNPAVHSASGVDAWEALRIAEAVYESSRSGTTIALCRSVAAIYDGAHTGA